MKGTQLSRRTVLSGIAVAGGAGSLVGGGTAALFTDEEVFKSNTIRASTKTGGVVDMDVTTEEIDENDGVQYQITLPDEGSSTSTNTPAYIWLRTLSCPTPEELAKRVQVEVTVSYDGATSEILVAEQSLFDLLNDLQYQGGIRDGINVGRLADDPCLQPDDEWFVDIEVTEVTESNGGGNNGNGNSGDDEELTFELEFYGQQCRYQSGSENPFGWSDVIDPCGSHDGNENAISFIGFCAGDTDLEGEIDPTDLTVTNSKDGGEPLAVSWECDEAVETAVVKAGSNMENFHVGGATSGTVEVGEGTEADGQSPSSPCPSGEGLKFNWEDDGWEVDQ